jgi:intein/homing endonuclease
MKKYVDPNTLAEYTEQICSKRGTSDGFKAAILAQIRKMKEIYGDKIPSDDFLHMFGQQYESLKTGYKKQPVDIEEFLLSVEYMSLKGTIRQKVLDTLVDIFGKHNHCYEVTLSGCVDLDSYILEADGNISKLGKKLGKFKDVSICDKAIFSEKSDGGSYSGLKQVTELKLQNGRKIKLTPDHKVEIVRDGILKWEQAGNIKNSDLVRCPRFWKTNPKIKMSEDFAFFLGCWSCDGSSSNTRARINSSNREYITVLHGILKKYGFDNYLKDRGNVLELNVCRAKTSGFLNLLDEYNMFAVPCKEVDIPEQVLTSDNNAVAGFLRGVWASDGVLYTPDNNTPSVRISLISKVFIEKLQYILLRFGIQSHYNKLPPNLKTRHPNAVYILNIYGSDNLEKFCNIIGDIPGRKDRVEKIKKYVSNRNRNSNVDLAPVLYTTLRDILKRHKVLVWKLPKWKNLATACCTRKYPTMDTFNLFCNHFKHIPEVADLWNSVDQNSVFVRVVSNVLLDLPVQTGDIGVPAINKFIANGISVHNSTRWGKTYLTCCAFAYHVYKLSCLYNPQTHYHLAPGSEIVFLMQSVKEDKARRNFHEFRGMIASSEYFKKHFPPQGKAVNYAIFPHSIKVKPAPATSTAGISENVFSAFIDEANFMKIVKGSPNQGLNEGYYDQATKIYYTIKDRIQNQFKDFETGEWPGKLYLSSSANHKEDFIQTKKKEHEQLVKQGKKSHIYVADYALWEVKDVNKSGEKFWVQMPTENDAGRILDKKPSIMNDDIIEVPIELRDQFEQNLHDAIRNVAGRPLERESKFIPSSALTENIENYNKYYDGNQIFSVQEVNINDVDNLNSILNLPFIKSIDQYGVFHSHLDMSVSHDSAGLSISATMGSKTIESRQRYDLDTGEYVVEDEYTAPLYVVFGLLRINPPRSGQIELERMCKLYFALKEQLTNLRSMSADYAYSTFISQAIRKAGIKTSPQSVDKNSDPYVETKTAFMGTRLWVPDHEKLKEEIKNVNMNLITGKIDHSILGSKDVADAVAGGIYVLSKRKATYKKQGEPPSLKEMLKAAKEPEPEQKSTRPSSGNRTAGWQSRRGRRRKL